MSMLIARVELHQKHKDEVIPKSDYDTLHAAMEVESFKREIIDGETGKKFHTLTADYLTLPRLKHGRLANVF